MIKKNKKEIKEKARRGLECMSHFFTLVYKKIKLYMRVCMLPDLKAFNFTYD